MCGFLNQLISCPKEKEKSQQKTYLNLSVKPFGVDKISAFLLEIETWFFFKMTTDEMRSFAEIRNHSRYQMAMYHCKNVSNRSQGGFGMFTFVKERFGKMYSKNVLILIKIYFFIKYRKKKRIGERNFHWAKLAGHSWVMQLMLDEEKSSNCCSSHCLVYLSICVLLTLPCFSDLQDYTFPFKA